MATAMESIAVLSSPSSSSRLVISVARPAMTVAFLTNRRSFEEFNRMKIQSFSKLSLAWSNSRYPRFSKHRGLRGGVVCNAQETALDIPAVNDQTWESNVLKADGPVLVEFWAPWCGPCRMIHPVIVELAEQYSGKLKCFKLNTDDSPSIATKYGIRSIPTIMIFINGERKDSVIGAVPKTTLCASIDKSL